jgi:polysaccharide export outer membrane protein
MEKKGIRRMLMAHRFAFGSLVTIACLIGDIQGGTAQQMPSTGQSQGGSQPGSALPASGRNSSGASNVLRNSSLNVVPPDFAKLKLAPGFLVSLDVLDDPDFEGNFRVDQHGDLALPILGNIHVGGETASEAMLQIKQKLLSDQILTNPQVNLNVVEYAAPEVTIIGEVSSPGRYPLLAPRSLTDVLALAGGLTPAAGTEIQIMHESKDAEPLTIHYSRATESRTVQDSVVRPGDTVQVKRAGIVYVLGAVNKPGGYIMQEDGTLTVLEAISIANGTTLPASVGTVYLLRRNSDGTAIRIELPLNKMQHGKDADMQLHATDVLYVPTSKIKAVLINSQGILAAATSASIYATAAY